MVLSSVPDHATHVEEDQLGPGLPDNYQDKTSVDTLPQKRESLVGMWASSHGCKRTCRETVETVYWDNPYQ
jgi:hypothetical protein